MLLELATGSSLALFFAGSPAFCFPAATSTRHSASAFHLSSAIRRCRDCPVFRCVELLMVVLTLDSYLSLCRLVLAY